MKGIGLYQLYYYPLNASMAPHFILEHLNIEFELVLVDRKTKAQKSSEYLALNPAGRIPTLVHSEQVISESSAICIYLAEAHPESGLIPELGNPDRAKFFQWMMYLTNTVQAELMLYYYPHNHCSDASSLPAIVTTQEQRVTGMLELIDKELANRDYLVGQQLTACDFYLFMLCVWADELERPPLSFEHLSKHLKKLAKNQAIRAVCKIENLSLTDYQ